MDDCGPPGDDDCYDLECQLCPGQTTDDLPPECEENECPPGSNACTGDGDCSDGQYCNTGCCVNIVT